MVLNIDTIRKEKGASLVDLADCINTNTLTVRRKIDGESSFKWDEAKKIHKEFFPEFDIDFLFSEKKVGG